MKRIAIVGGGLAGIAAALDCADGDAAVTLLESRGRLGGAAYSFTRDGILVDNGQHVFLRCCTAYRELLGRIGAIELVTLQPRLSMPVLAPGGKIGWLRRSGLPAPLHLAGSLARYPFLGVRQRVSLARAMRALRAVDADDPIADARSFGDWLAEHGQDEETVERIWALIARPTLNLIPADASLAQAAYVFQEGLLRDAAAGDIGYARVPLGRDSRSGRTARIGRSRGRRPPAARRNGDRARGGWLSDRDQQCAIARGGRRDARCPARACRAAASAGQRAGTLAAGFAGQLADRQPACRL